jgi:L-cysteine S-thiosulfotransferase
MRYARIVSRAAKFAALLAASLASSAAQEGLKPFDVVGDAIPTSLTGGKGDPERGRVIVTNRYVGLSLLCHSGPFPEERIQGTLAPNLKGAGSRWSEGSCGSGSLMPGGSIPTPSCRRTIASTA